MLNEKLIATSTPELGKYDVQQPGRSIDFLPSKIEGWFPVCFSYEIADKEIIPFTFMGLDLIVWRGESGHLNVFDAYCPHLGAHLKDGSVRKDNIFCPFHGWGFSQRGEKLGPKCNKATSIRTWPVDEVNGLVFVYYGATEPEWRIEPLPFSDYGPISQRTSRKFTVDFHLQELSENGVDVAHFRPIHSFRRFSFHGVEYNEHKMVTKSSSDLLLLDWKYLPIAIKMHQTMSLAGLGYTVVSLDYEEILIGKKVIVIPQKYRHFGRAYIAARPTGETTLLHFSASVARPKFLDKLPAWLAAGVHDVMAGLVFRQAALKEILKDFHIWSNKVYISDPPYSKRDGPIAEFRQWCKRFYADAVLAD